MTNKDKISPLPWDYIGNSWQYTTMYDANKKPIAELDLEFFEGMNENNQEKFEAIQTANAAFIRKSVNNYDIMQKTIKDLVKKLKTFSNESFEIEHDSYSLQGHEHFNPQKHIKASKKLIKETQALLNKLKEV